MKKRTALISCVFCLVLNLIFSSGLITAQNITFTLTKAQAIEDFQWLRFALEYVHPRLYKYEDKQTVDARFDSLTNCLYNGISGLDFLAMVSFTNATVRCGHLFTIPQGELAKEILRKKVLPFHIKILDEKIYLFHDCSNSSIPNGSQILSINNKSDKEIISRILPGIASDGYILTRKIKLIDKYFFNTVQGFDLYYYLYVDRGDVFKIDYIKFGTNNRESVTLKGIPTEERQKILLERYNSDDQEYFKTPSPKFKIDDQKKYALLTFPRSFYDKTIDPDFDSLLNSAFSRIKDEEIKNLIIDLRNNEGGSEHQQIELMSYLYEQPFKLYQNIYISHLDFRPLQHIIIERDTSDLLFNNDDGYMRKINDNLWINNYEYSENLKLKPPKNNVFRGKLYVLMNGTCFSSGADLISDISKTTDAIFIGEESGGTFEGPTGGDNIAIQLPNSKIMIRISPNIQIGSMYQKHPIGRGVFPTYKINYCVKDIVEGKDLEMEYAISLIKRNE